MRVRQETIAISNISSTIGCAKQAVVESLIFHYKQFDLGMEAH